MVRVGLRLVSSFDRDAYSRPSRRVLEYIAAGDLFQVNLSQRFSGRGSFDRWTSISGSATAAPPRSRPS